MVFLCSPVPSLTWSRNDGRQLPVGRYTISHYNSELEIRNVTKSDEGDYKCEANSRSGRDRVIIQIDVQCTWLTFSL